MVNEARLYYEDVAKRSPLSTISVSQGIPRIILEEIVYMVENDQRFVRAYKKEPSTADLHDYEKLCNHLKIVWHFEIQPRQLRYVYRVTKLHNELLDKLQRGGYMRDTYSNLVYKKA